jgi:hypothetical protein
MMSHAEAAASEQLPQVSEKGGKCGDQIAACTDPYPCCSAAGQCGCTGAHCGSGCQSLYGTCGTSTPQSPAQSPTTGTPTTPGDETPITSVTNANSGTSCSHAWVQSAIEENNKLRSLTGAAALACDETASQLAASWSQEMCSYVPATLTLPFGINHACCMS